MQIIFVLSTCFCIRIVLVFEELSSSINTFPSSLKLVVDTVDHALNFCLFMIFRRLLITPNKIINPPSKPLLYRFRIFCIGTIVKILPGPHPQLCHPPSSPESLRG
jgi:hypothetical protein